MLQVLNCHHVTVRRSGLEPLPGCPEGILSPPAGLRKATTYPVIQGEASLGFVRVGAAQSDGFRYQNRYQPTFHVAHLTLKSAAPAAGPLWKAVGAGQ